MSAELKWRRKVGRIANKYPYITLPVEFSDWVGGEVEVVYQDGKLIITLVDELEEK